MNTEIAVKKSKRLWDRRGVKIGAVALGLLLVFGALVQFKVIKLGKSSTAAVTRRTDVVKKGTLSNSLAATAPVEAMDKADVLPYVPGKVKKVYFKEGDQVKAGDVLFELDNAEALASIENLQNNIKQNEISMNSSEEDIRNLTIRAPFSGQVTNLAVKEGDEAGKGAVVLNLTDRSKLKLTIPFSAADIGNIKTSQKVQVYIQDLMQKVEGKVTYVSQSSYATTGGGIAYSVEIELQNPGTLNEGMKASAEIERSGGTMSAMDAGTLTWVNSRIIKSSTGGTVQKLNVRENQSVKAGETLIILEDKNLLDSRELNDLKTDSLYKQLATAQAELDQYLVRAPLEGTILKQSINPGDEVKNGDVLCTIANTSTMKLTLAIDELDIAKVRTGQKASITCDALPETATKPLEGIVTAVALEGTSSNGVSTYPVTVSFPSVEGLKVGMNANADILVDHKENVLMLPIEAVQTVNGISIVMVPGTGTQADRSQWGSSSPNGMRAGQGTNGQKRPSQAQSGQQGSYSQGGQSGQQRPDQSQSGNLAQRRALQGSSQQSEYYKNTVPKKVETGISNETHIEIISGLNEGDQVILPPVTTGQSSTTQQAQGGGANPFGGMGGNRIMGGGNR